jgi:hypothetical protein
VSSGFDHATDDEVLQAKTLAEFYARAYGAGWKDSEMEQARDECGKNLVEAAYTQLGRAEAIIFSHEAAKAVWGRDIETKPLYAPNNDSSGPLGLECYYWRLIHLSLASTFNLRLRLVRGWLVELARRSLAKNSK